MLNVGDEGFKSRESEMVKGTGVDGSRGAYVLGDNKMSSQVGDTGFINGFPFVVVEGNEQVDGSALTFEPLQITKFYTWVNLGQEVL